jgi:DNA-binding MarR family transcriptional regulator
MALPRRPPAPERYETARRLMSRVPGADVAAMELCLRLWRFSDELSASFEAFYAAHDLSSARVRVLVQLFDTRDGLTPAQLAERAGATPPTVTGLLHSLERQGLIRRHGIATDRRSHCIRLTPSGRARVTSLLPMLAKRLARLTGALTPSERRSIVQVCEHICKTTRALSKTSNGTLPETKHEERPRRSTLSRGAVARPAAGGIGRRRPRGER